ncbi:hypothetical protein QTP70_011049 [Hemibagrus guttatus]|uniref:Reverse transcriptase domain-containing protein n=1 Tax=Hemibagrus guttatus TaxID=175788 RepID=A0AAE0V2M8_9TELE|nr:hypothetical protein QTP70_011049 [Hemibagrus guttatus]
MTLKASKLEFLVLPGINFRGNYPTPFDQSEFEHSLVDLKISARIKGKVYRTVVRPAMLYGLETVSLRKRQESELEVAELKMLRQWWDHGKVLIQQLCREYTVNITRDITKSLKDLEIGIVELQALAESTGDRRHVEDLKVKKALMADLLGTKARGALIRSRFKGANEMDVPSKYFFGLEKKNGQSRLIHTLHTGNGQYTTHTDEIRRYATDFYQDLYRSEHRDSKELLDTFYQGLPQVSSEDNTALEGPLVLEELQVALNTMPGGKAPGIDGLPVEFYKFFWKELGEDLLEVLEESCRERCLPLSSQRAVITLLPKKGDLQDIKNWRPVSLLCTDYKVMSKALANRLRDIMDSVIQTDQTYCVPNRSIIDSVSLIRDILDVSSMETLFKRGSHSPAVALYWLLEEPLVGGGLMDIKDSSPGLTHITQSEKFTTLKRLVDTAGPEFKDTRAVAEELSLRSLQYTEFFIQRWTNKLSEDELNLIKEYHDGTETPDRGDPFPELELLPDLNGYEGMYLDAEKGHVLPIYEAKGKDIYKCCVKVINKRKLDRRVDTVWRQELGVLDDIKPVWKVFYKTPLRKRAGVLQWRILHGAVGVNVLISKLNPDVLQTCPFCNETETVFHCDSGCKRLNPLLELLKTFLICLVRNGLGYGLFSVLDTDEQKNRNGS